MKKICFPAVLISGWMICGLSLSAQDNTSPDTITIPAKDKPIIQLSGMITNDAGNFLPFVTIAIMNRGKGTVSDFWGYYSVAVGLEDTVRFSSVGYKRFAYSFPSGFSSSHFELDITLVPDTVMLAETVVFPWTTYDQFLRAVVELDLPEDDLERARKNIAFLQKQLISDEYQVDAGLNYKYFMEDKYRAAYTAGQYPSVSLLNPLAWAQFFDALKNGLFRNKKKIY